MAARLGLLGDGDAVGFGDFGAAGGGDVEVADEAVLKGVDPAVHGQLAAGFPRFLHHGGMADVQGLLHDVQFAQAIEHRFVVRDLGERLVVLLADVADVAEPAID